MNYCKDCQSFKRKTPEYGLCQNDDANSKFSLLDWDETVSEDFGCIYFAPKINKNCGNCKSGILVDGEITCQDNHKTPVGDFECWRENG